MICKLALAITLVMTIVLIYKTRRAFKNRDELDVAFFSMMAILTFAVACMAAIKVFS